MTTAIHIAIHKEVYARADSEADAKAQQLTPSTRTRRLTPSPSRCRRIDGARADLVFKCRPPPRPR